MYLNLNQELQNKYPHLEVSVLKYSDAMKDNDSKRIDSEFFKKEYLENEKIFELFTETIGNICDKNIKNIKGLKLNKKFNYLQISDIDISNGLVYSTIETDFNEIPDRATYVLQDNDICVSTVRPNRNAVSLIYNAKRIIGTSGFCVLRPNTNKVLPSFLYIFCKTEFFISAMMRANTASLYPAVSNSDIYKCKIPLFPLEFQQQIEQMVRESHACLEQSKGLYREAEVLLYRELGLDPENPLASIEPHSGSLNISVRPLSQSLNTTGRLDSEYYQQKYDEIEKVIKNYRGGYGKISDYFKQNKKSKSFILSEYKYIEIGDINVGTATANYNIIQTNDLPANAKIFLNNGDLLISKVRPNRGAIAIVNFDENDLIGSGAFCVLQEIGEIKKEVLMILLRTPLYKEWLLKFNVGTSYPVIKDEDILNLIIPKIAIETQTQIAEKIKQSFTLRRKANDLLLTAKQTVETAIEKG